MNQLKTKDEFKIGKNEITWVGSSFQEVFYNTKFKPEKFKLVYKVLEKSMTDEEILKELKPQEVTLGDVLNTIKTNKDLLINNGYANIFYIKDQKGVLQVVDVLWFGDGWHVFAYSASLPDRWSAGRQVFSRKFLFDPLTPPSPLENRVKDLESKVAKLLKVINSN